MSTSEEDIYERIAGLLPEANRAAYYRHIARVRQLHPDDDVLAIVEACGYLTLICVEIPMALADTRQGIEEALARLQSSSTAPSSSIVLAQEKPPQPPTPAGAAELKTLSEELARFNRQLGEARQEMRSVKEYPRLAERLRSRSQWVVALFAAIAVGASFLLLKERANQSVERNMEALRQQFIEGGEFARDVRNAGGTLRYYKAQDRNGQPAWVLVVNGAIRDAGINKEGGAFIVLKP